MHCPLHQKEHLMSFMLMDSIRTCILSLSDSQLIELQIVGGRFFVDESTGHPHVGLSIGPPSEHEHHKKIAHLVSIPWEKEELLDFDEINKMHIPNSPMYTRQNLFDWIEKILNDILDKQDQSSI